MKTLSLLAAVLALGLTLGTAEAEAKRLGGGRSSGMQRESVTQTAPGATPAHASTAPAAATAPAYKPAAATPPAAAQPKRSWMGPLAGIAAGLGLAALASHFGFGAELASALTMGLLAMVVVAVIGMVMRRRAAAQQPAAGGMQYAGAAAQPEAAARGYEVAMPAAGGSAIGAGLDGGAAAGSAIGAGLGAAAAMPAGFDVEAFVRNAKVNFIRLQAANDAGRLDDIREFTTPEMFAELQMDILERGGALQQTEVVSLEAQVLEVLEEGARYVASVRYSGLVREQKGAAAEPFDEVWHLSKPRAGAGGWILSGIQQLQRH
ncbi:MAG: hypothetical protein RJA36_3361 [Pseudomonadota bacterium]|jgi:predicted lipid-binding transport protein (Tim44 family)